MHVIHDFQHRSLVRPLLGALSAQLAYYAEFWLDGSCLNRWVGSL